ncbi:hypothetical protein BDW22DRAFT_66461 [Trametopsis cervina]|nr:hypothetical protein BDW22DRAFT_66461 [Trametopsis cervina]
MGASRRDVTSDGSAPYRNLYVRMREAGKVQYERLEARACLYGSGWRVSREDKSGCDVVCCRWWKSRRRATRADCTVLSGGPVGSARHVRREGPDRTSAERLIICQCDIAADVFGRRVGEIAGCIVSYLCVCGRVQFFVSYLRSCAAGRGNFEACF